MSHATVKSNIKEVIDKNMKKNSGNKIGKCDNSKCKADQKMKQTLQKHKLQDALAKKKENEKKNSCDAKKAKKCDTCAVDTKEATKEALKACKCNKCPESKPCKKNDAVSA